MQASLSLSILHFKFQLRYRSRARRHTNCVDNFVKMVKSKNVLAEKATSNITDSALKRSAFQRRKQYGAQLKKSGVVSKTVKENIGTASKKTNANDTKKTSTASNTIRRNSKAFSSKPSNLPKFKSSVSREEMEELGCLPVGILFSGSGMRNRKATLSFSPHTKAFERTPIRGTPIRGMSLTGQQKTERVAEVLATLQRLEEALKNETATCAEVLTDLKGLELGRRSTVSDIAEFWMLKTQLLSESGDRKEAILAAVQAIFTTKHKKAKAELAREINTMLAVEVATGDSDGEEGQELEEDTVANRESNSAESVKNLFPTEHSKDQEKVFVAPDKTNSIEDSHLMLKNSQPKRSETPAASPEHLYTPPDVKTTPMVRTNQSDCGNGTFIHDEQFMDHSCHTNQLQKKQDEDFLVSAATEAGYDSQNRVTPALMQVDYNRDYDCGNHIVFLNSAENRMVQRARLSSNTQGFNNLREPPVPDAEGEAGTSTHNEMEARSVQAALGTTVHTILYVVAIINIALGYLFSTQT